MAARHQAYTFSNEHCCRRRTRSDQQPSKDTNVADQSYKKSRHCRKKRSNDKTRDIVIPLGGVENFLLTFHTFPATIAGWCVDRAGSADRAVAIIASQSGLTVRVHVAVQSFGC